eukprot:6913360-Pyramimonas_sp.AAC.1
MSLVLPISQIHITSFRFTGPPVPITAGMHSTPQVHISDSHIRHVSSQDGLFAGIAGCDVGEP